MNMFRKQNESVIVTNLKIFKIVTKVIRENYKVGV